MKKLKFKKIEELNPHVYDKIINKTGQKVEFWEHPTLGDDYPVIVAFPELELAFNSEFMETSDMTGGDDYEPHCVDGELKFSFELK